MEKNNKSSIVFIIHLISYIILLPILTLLFKLYYNFQASVFSNENTLLFINNAVAIYIIVFSPAIIILCILLRIKNISALKIMKIKLYSFIAILTFLISVFILICQFFEYSDIGKERICVRNGLFFSYKDYMWSDVKYAEVSYKHTNKSNIEIIYNIYLNDGTVVNVRNSKDFFSKIINLDDFIKSKKVEIVRSTLDSKDYNEFESSLKSKDKDVSHNAQVVLQILNK